MKGHLSCRDTWGILRCSLKTGFTVKYILVKQWEINFKLVIQTTLKEDLGIILIAPKTPNKIFERNHSNLLIEILRHRIHR